MTTADGTAITLGMIVWVSPSCARGVVVTMGDGPVGVRLDSRYAPQSILPDHCYATPGGAIQTALAANAAERARLIELAVTEECNAEVALQFDELTVVRAERDALTTANGAEITKGMTVWWWESPGTPLVRQSDGALEAVTLPYEIRKGEVNLIGDRVSVIGDRAWRAADVLFSTHDAAITAELRRLLGELVRVAEMAREDGGGK